ncbi:MAG: hypothetical protein WB421_09720 [Terriglobales bacterium]
MKTGKADKELEAIGTILRALDGLEGESIQRVLDYVFGRLSIGQTRTAAPLQTTALSPSSTGSTDFRRAQNQVSIRDLKEQKQPESSNQMAALVAYYLSEVAPEAERKPSINASDLEKYFKQAGFKLPQKIPQTLPNAAAAGYFDATGNGVYQLNPVGYNLVVHGLPRGHGQAPARKKTAAKRKSGRR